MGSIGSGIESLIRMVGGELDGFRQLEALLAASIAFVVFRGVRSWDFWRRFAANMPLVILIAALLPVVIRLAVLPLVPPPVPFVHDEFSHLLVADTMLAGRLANPPHPMSDHFEVPHVLQNPTYASMYPPGPGAGLALGILLFGHPWAGVLLCFALMCAAAAWAAYGWAPREWAAAASLLCGIVYGVSTSWLNSYWGGAVAGIGSGLLFGSIPRLVRTLDVRYALAGAAGWSICWLSRPYESAVLALPLAGASIFWAARKPAILRSLLLPAGAVVLAAFAFSAYFNWRVTGDPLRMPYQAGQRQYGYPATFLWQPMPPPDSFKTPALRDNYLWQLANKSLLLDPVKFTGQAIKRLFESWRFFIGLPLLIPLFVYLRRARGLEHLPWIFWLVAWAGSTVYAFFFPHYFGPYTAMFLSIAALGLSRLDRRLAAFCIVFALLDGLQIVRFSQTAYWNGLFARGRAHVERQLLAKPGQHLVLLRYSPRHVFHDEFAYNKADIDGSRIVWATSLGPQRDARLLKYFAGRSLWIYEPDEPKPELRPLIRGDYRVFGE
ncbi:MAG: hypothetical protein K2X35_02225 [Bryobacteraceae bacterium]|nr:hypothetical protein [Bryobacteraceae bacterium]